MFLVSLARINLEVSVSTHINDRNFYASSIFHLLYLIVRCLRNADLFPPLCYLILVRSPPISYSADIKHCNVGKTFFFERYVGKTWNWAIWIGQYNKVHGPEINPIWRSVIWALQICSLVEHWRSGIGILNITRFSSALGVTLMFIGACWSTEIICMAIFSTEIICTVIFSRNTWSCFF